MLFQSESVNACEMRDASTTSEDPEVDRLRWQVECISIDIMTLFFSSRWVSRRYRRRKPERYCNRRV